MRRGRRAHRGLRAPLGAGDLIHCATIVNVGPIARVECDWRDQPMITLKPQADKFTGSRTFAHRFKAL
jgi:hypothetical protein